MVEYGEIGVPGVPLNHLLKYMAEHWIFHMPEYGYG